MDDTELQLRKAIIDKCRWMNATGLNQGTSGNISARHGDTMLISPSATPYDIMTPEMVAKARRNASPLGLVKVEFALGEVERLPLADASVDPVVSNGVFNLCPDRSRAPSEVFRVLKLGGRLPMAYNLLEPHVTPEEAARKGTWSD